MASAIHFKKLNGYEKRNGLQPLNDHSEAHSSAGTQGSDAQTETVGHHTIEKSNNQPAACCADRMTQRNPVSANVHLFPIKAQFLFTGKILGGKGFIDFESLNVVQVEFRFP